MTKRIAKIGNERINTYKISVTSDTNFDDRCAWMDMTVLTDHQFLTLCNMIIKYIKKINGKKNEPNVV